MQTATPSPADEPLYNLVSGQALATIPDVIARMQAIDVLLPVTLQPQRLGFKSTFAPARQVSCGPDGILTRHSIVNTQPAPSCG
jgi:hypothetical protein